MKKKKEYFLYENRIPNHAVVNGFRNFQTKKKILSHHLAITFYFDSLKVKKKILDLYMNLHLRNGEAKKHKNKYIAFVRVYS